MKKKSPPILFCNIGWMEHYQGQRKGADEITGGGGYIIKHGRGDEICNFVSVEGMHYGWVQPAGEQIALERIDENGGTGDSISGVTVVWTAKRQGVGTVVVGWYLNAIVFREKRRQSKRSALHRKNHVKQYRIEAPARYACLLPVDKRICKIPRQVKGGMGQANVWYADSPLSKPTVERVLDLIGGKYTGKSVRPIRTKNQDQERKARVEKAAVRCCCDHFEKLGYVVTSVEKDNVGWDLEAQLGKLKLRIEVKGLSEKRFAVEMTPNEYLAFSKQHEFYRLAVVVNALTDPSLSICRFSREQGEWVAEGSSEGCLRIMTKMSATISLEMR